MEVFLEGGNRYAYMPTVIAHQCFMDKEVGLH